MMQIAAGNIDTVKDFIIYQVRLFSTKDAGHGGFSGLSHRYPDARRFSGIGFSFQRL